MEPNLTAWSEYFDYQRWMDALSACGLDGDFYAHRVREKDELFPGQYQQCGVSPGIPVAGAELCYQSVTTPDCPVTLLGLWGQQNADRR